MGGPSSDVNKSTAGRRSTRTAGKERQREIGSEATPARAAAAEEDSLIGTVGPRRLKECACEKWLVRKNETIGWRSNRIERTAVRAARYIFAVNGMD